MNKHKFNIFPEMQSDDYSRLKNDIQENGYDLKQPIYLYENEILDGWNRFRVCQELNVQPIYKDFIGSDFEAINFVMRTNKRRNLTSSQWAAIAVEADEIVEAIRQSVEAERRKKQAESLSNTLHGVSDNKLTETKNEHETKTSTKIAKLFNTNRTYINEADKLRKEKPEVFQQVKRGEKTITDVKREEKKEEKLRKREEQAESAKTLKVDVDFRLGDFEEVFSDIADGSVDCIITDPPYPKEFIECWTKLSRFAKRVLKPNGFCIAYSGQMNLPEVINRMSENLTYYWTFSLIHTGSRQLINGRSLFCGWKPILIFQNGFKKIESPFDDFIMGSGMEKTEHKWQQGKDELYHLIENFTKPGELIIEPFAGGGTTIIAALELKRNIKAAEIDEESYNIAKSRIWKNLGAISIQS